MVPLEMVTVTERNQYRTCRRKWLWDKEGRYPPRKIPTPLVFGSMMHRALERYHGNARTLEDLLAGLRQGADEQIAALVDGRGFCREAAEAEIEGLYPQGADTLALYADYDHTVTDPEWEVVDVERRHTVTISPDLPPLSGQIDLLVRVAGDLFVVDHKNVSRKQDQRAVDIDPQLSGYCYLVREVYGEMPRGAIINALIKKKPSVTLRAPKLGTQPWDGRFYRITTERSADAIDAYPWRASVEMREMVAVAAEPERAYPNPGWQCSSCGYLDRCMEDLSGAQGSHLPMPWDEE